MVDDVELLDADIIDYHITIPLRDVPEEDSVALFLLANVMRGNGITFDTGFGSDGREWFLDWSLDGATPEVVIQKLRDTKVKFQVEMRVRENDEDEV